MLVFVSVCFLAIATKLFLASVQKPIPFAPRQGSRRVARIERSYQIFAGVILVLAAMVQLVGSLWTLLVRDGL